MRRGSGERLGEPGADFSRLVLPRVQKSARRSPSLGLGLGRPESARLALDLG
jgi:hypothetical protein